MRFLSEACSWKTASAKVVPKVGLPCFFVPQLDELEMTPFELSPLFEPSFSVAGDCMPYLADIRVEMAV